MKIDLGQEFLSSLTNGDYADIPLQEAVLKEVMIQVLRRINNLEEREAQQTLKNIFSRELEESPSAEIFPFKPDDKE